MITFAVTGTITLTSGGLVIDKNVTISGPGADQLSIDGNQAQFCVFGIFPGKTVTISGLTISNAEASLLCNEQGTLTVSDCAITSSSYQGLYNHEATFNREQLRRQRQRIRRARQLVIPIIAVCRFLNDRQQHYQATIPALGVVNEAHRGPANNDPR